MVAAVGMIDPFGSGSLTPLTVLVEGWSSAYGWERGQGDNECVGGG
jgi:hypothetical protein